MSLFAAGVSTLGNTAGNTGTQYGTIVLAGSNNITLSQVTGSAGVHTIHVQAGGGGAQATVRLYQHPDVFGFTGGIANAQMSLMRFQLPYQMTATRLILLGHMSGASNSTGAYTLSAGVFTMSGSTASLATSGSRSFSWSSGSETSASSRYGGQSGTQYRSIAVNLTLTAGDYLMGLWMRTSNAGSWTFYGKSSISSIVNGQDANHTNLFLDGFTTASFTTAMPSSIHLTNYAKTGQSALRQHGFILGGSL